MMGHPEPEHYDLALRIRKKLASRNWLALSWPVEYGGSGADVLTQTVFTEEVEYLRAPALDSGVRMIGPCIISHGTDEQKREHLGPIARAETIWAQGFSEPEAGSDLASLQTRAVRDGDDFVINGQKVWTSRAHIADWLHVLARTDLDVPKHKGITYFLLDAKSPGIDIRLLQDMSGGQHFSEVFFNDVRVPARNILGEENTGWYVATTTLNLERSNIGFSAFLRGLLEEVTGYLRSLGPNGPLSNPLVRHKLAEIAIGNQVSRMLSYRIAWMQHTGQQPVKEASLSKLFSSELHQRAPQAFMEMIGLHGNIEINERHAPVAGAVQHLYRHAIAATIGAGTSEIQRNIIANRGLGLPRG
jgi:alkylation response protein AidB-like acyl-CoA dehydrogenase